MATPLESSSPRPEVPARPTQLDARSLVQLVGRLRRALSVSARALRDDDRAPAASLCRQLGLDPALADAHPRLAEELDGLALLTGRLDPALAATARDLLADQLGQHAWFLPLLTRLVALPPSMWRVEPAGRRWTVASLVAPEPVERSVGQMLSADDWLDVDRVATRLVFGWNLRHLQDAMLVVAAFEPDDPIVDEIADLATRIDPLERPLRFREAALSLVVRAMARELGLEVDAAATPAPSTHEPEPVAPEARAVELPDAALEPAPRYAALVELVQTDDQGLAAVSLERLELDANTQRRLESALDTLDRGTDTLGDLPARADALLEVKGFGTGTLCAVIDGLQAVVEDRQAADD